VSAIPNAGQPEPQVALVRHGTELLHQLASPRWMLAFFLFAGASAVVSMERPEWITPIWVVPLAMFAVSLMAAVATNRRFRRDPALLGLHFGLLVFVVLVGVARLTYLDGAVTLTKGTAFDGQLHLDRRGPLHPGKVESLRFSNEGFTEDFDPRARWKATYNRVRWWDSRGVAHEALIGDHHPLVLEGYRIYTTRNRGYSAVFHWHGVGGGDEIGTVELRPGEFDLANTWQLPGEQEIWAMLAPSDPVEVQRGELRRDLGADKLAHRLVIRAGDRREVLRLGESMEFPEGRLTYAALDSWMGYHLVHDFAMHWMVAAAAAVVGCMIWFYARLLGRGRA
jgi:hypothetical protein